MGVRRIDEARLDAQPAHDLGGAELLRASFREAVPETGRPLDEVLSRLEAAIAKSYNTAGPGYLAYIPGGGVYASALADFIAAATNRYVGVSGAAPALAQIEETAVSWLGTLMGMPAGTRGILTSGGSLSNFMLPACDAVFRHVVEQVMQISFRDYSELPWQFLARPAVRPSLKARASFGARKLYETHRAVRARCLPRSLLAPFHASQIVYSVVPLLFFAYGNEERGRMFETARRWLNLLGPLQPPSSDSAIEWDYLRQRLTYYWKMYCY